MIGIRVFLLWSIPSKKCRGRCDSSASSCLSHCPAFWCYGIVGLVEPCETWQNVKCYRHYSEISGNTVLFEYSTPPPLDRSVEIRKSNTVISSKILENLCYVWSTVCFTYTIDEKLISTAPAGFMQILKTWTLFFKYYNIMLLSAFRFVVLDTTLTLYKC